MTSERSKPAMLVVEDEALIRLDFVDQAQAAGFQTVEASSAPEALAILESRPDIRAVFTDIRMPGAFDGLELARRVSDRWPPIILVICSANELLADEKLPNVLFMSKPFTSPSIDRLLSNILAELA